MKISVETLSRTYAAGRNYINLGLGFATSLGLLSAAQDKTLSDSLSEVYSGITMIAHGFTSIWQVLVVVGAPFSGALLAWYAQRSAKTDSKVASVLAAAKDTSDPKSTEAAVVLSNAAAAVPGAQKVVNPAISDNPATSEKVTKS